MHLTATPFFPFLHRIGRLAGLALLFLMGQAQAQNGPSCTSYINKTVSDGLGSNTVNGVFAVSGPGSTTVYAATGGELDGGISISTDGGNTFINKTDADGLGDKSTTGVYVIGNYVYAATLGGLSISSDGGNSFINQSSANGLNADFITSVFALSGTTGPSSTTIYATSQAGLNISPDNGATWIPKSDADGLASQFAYGVFAVSGPGSTTLYVATGGGLSISPDGGTTWINKTTADGLGSNTTWSVYVIGSTVYVATDGGLSISTDGGNTFINKTDADGLGNSSALSVYAIGNTVYVGSYLGGISISMDGGNTFRVYKKADGLGSDYGAAVFALSNNVFVGTDGGLSFCAPAALPVNLVSFTAQSDDKKTVLLTWKTASETHNAYFLLEHSKNLVQAETVTSVLAAEGATLGHTYTYLDRQPYAGTSYYRLRQVDLDGHQTTYPWVSVVVDQQAYGVYPNPIPTNLFTVHLDEPDTALLSLYNEAGQPIAFQRLGYQDGNLTLKTSTTLTAGVYVLQVKERALTRQHRLVVE